MLLVAYLFYHSSKDALIERTVAQLSSINHLKKIYIEDYFEGMQQSTQLLARNSPLLELTVAPQASRDTAATNRMFSLLQQEFAYQDLILLDTSLHLLYQQTQSFQFPADTSAKFTEIRQLVTNTLANSHPGEILVDGEYLLFTSAPVKNASGQTTGILLMRLPDGPMEYVLHLRDGIGQTGESYVVGADFRMRSHSRFFPEAAPHDMEVRTLATQNAFTNQTTDHILADYRGVPVLSAYQPLQIPGLPWVIISEIDLEEAMQPVFRMRTIMVGIGLGVCVVIALLTWFVSVPLSARIRELRQVVLQLSRGIWPKEPLIITSKDEIGQMKGAMNQLILGLQRTAAFASEIGNGQLASTYEPLSNEDYMGNALLQMREKLQSSQQRELILNRQRTSALLEGEENERRRISRELHDGIGQLLTAIQFKLNTLDGQEKVRSEIKAILEETIVEVRRISHNLMPSVLQDFGLEAALKSLCTRTAQASRLKVNFSFDTHPDSPPLSQEVSISLYRITQESIHNAVKYAQATQLDIIVDCEPDQVQLRIRDNGIGFDWEAYQQRTTHETHGIGNMRERTYLLGGTFGLNTRAGAGTTITVSVPQ
ncbi:ATP-binding protein [Rhodocytophaga aerolata]|uniref:ATP-binding protein n=1 Tax=Rhodocytophaga aerolata TaxID=455078 RepID=UPI00366F5AF4